MLARIRLVVTLLLGVAIAIQLSVFAVRFAGAFKPTRMLHPGAAGHAVSAPRRAEANETLAQRIVAAHLFGTTPPRTARDAAAPQALKLELTLVGTLSEPNPEKGLAIIRLGEKATGVFPAHAQIDASTRLLRVFADHVVVDWRGGERVLAFPRSQSELPLLARETPEDESESQGPTKTVQGTGEQPMRMANYRRILDYIDYHPRIVGNAIDGIKISGVKDEEKLAKMGLHSGDIVTSVDGVPLTDPRRIDDLLKALSDGQAVTATVIRGGETSSEVLQESP